MVNHTPFLQPFSIPSFDFPQKISFLDLEFPTQLFLDLIVDRFLIVVGRSGGQFTGPMQVFLHGSAERSRCLRLAVHRTNPFGIEKLERALEDLRTDADPGLE